MAAIVRFKGIVKTLGGVEYEVPPISLRALQQLQSKINNFASELTDESIDTAVTVIHAALVRNYPEITIEQVGDMVDVANMFELFDAVMDVSGLKRKQLEEGAAGERKPAQE